MVVKINPCVALYGPGPAGATCATCVHLRKYLYNRTVYKCAKRKITGGAATDHKKRWPACNKYEVEATPL